jgi:hypothetical protein
MSSYPQVPFFVPELTMKSGGLDFLGMRQATLDLRDTCFPGFSNSTQYLRPFSLMCWTYWKLHALAEEAGLEVLSSEQARTYREKVEVLFTWGHKLNEVSGLPGITARAPQEAAGATTVPLTFKDWRRIPSSTGLMAAVNYGPALKTTSGFGFLNPVAHELFQPMAAGVELAKGLDESLMAHQIPAVLTTLEVNSGSVNDALSAFEGWNIETPGERERTAFRTVLYDGGVAVDDSEATALSMRSASFDLILAILKERAQSMDVEDIREYMFLGGNALPLVTFSARAKSARRRWVVLQVRQAQRLAMEALLSWIEKRILTDGARQSGDLAKAAVELCQTSERFIDRDWLQFAQNHTGAPFHDLEDAIQTAVAEEEMSIFFRMNELVREIREESDDVLPDALALLGLCRDYAVVMQEIPELHDALRFGGSEGLSLSLWNEICGRANDLTSYEFILMVIEELILSRHFAVATRRYDGNVIRLRITIGEEGLEALVPRPWRPVPAQDKLASGLSLMADCGLIVRTGSGYASL